MYENVIRISIAFNLILQLCFATMMLLSANHLFPWVATCAPEPSGTCRSEAGTSLPSLPCAIQGELAWSVEWVANRIRQIEIGKTRLIHTRWQAKAEEIHWLSNFPAPFWVFSTFFQTALQDTPWNTSIQPFVRTEICIGVEQRLG